ncbi:MAG: histidinol-phosphate transaminase [Proteobacteria bacterium]|nr:histidinol-phosphate transaminase [Pseudomonadota bacterium]
MFSSRLKNLVPYVPGEQPQDRKYIKLNTNENPYPPTPRIGQFLNRFDAERLRLYPDPLFLSLREKIAGRYGITKDQVFVGNGSDEVLAFSFYAFFDSEKGNLLFPEFTYSFYPVYCDLFDISYTKVPLAHDFNIDIAKIMDAGKSCGAIFPNPNAPTGMLLPLEHIKSLLAGYDENNVVLVDEAYIDFGGESAVSLIDQYKNLIVVRTLSKSMSLAGIRIGFAMGNPGLIQALFAVKDSFNSYPANVLSQEIAQIAFSDADYYNAVVEKIINTRTVLSKELKQIGWDVLPSSANFVFARKTGFKGKEIYLKLKERGILVRHFSTPGIDEFVRITIGTDQDTTVLVKEMQSCF